MCNHMKSQILQIKINLGFATFGLWSASPFNDNVCFFLDSGRSS